MADGTHIEWTQATWNPITGCSVISPGCKHCYAMKLAGTRLQHHPSRAGLTTMTKVGPVWTGEVRFNEQWLDQPLRWTTPRDIFVVAHGDLFHEAVTDKMIDRVFAVMALSPHHRFQVLTKRTDRMRQYLESWPGGCARFHWIADEACILDPTLKREGPDAYVWWLKNERWPLPNVWLGTSIEDQTRADERRYPLQDIASAGWRTWVSYEPALGPVNWQDWGFIKWLVSGGESGPGARPSRPNWHRAARDFCVANRIPYFFKQWGNWAPSTFGIFGTPPAEGDTADTRGMVHVGKKAAGSDLDGREWKQMPEQVHA